MKRTSGRLTEIEVLNALNKAHHHDLCRQVNEGLDCLKEVWENHLEKPSLDGFSPTVQGEILLRCGTFMGYYCFYKQLRNCLEPAKDWLTEAIEIFSSLNNQDKAAEAELEMGNAYFREGSYREALPWYLSAAERNTSPLHPVSIKLYACMVVNYRWLEMFHEAMELIREHDTVASLCEDKRVKVHYYINSGSVMFDLEKYPDALNRFQKANKFAREVGNSTFEVVSQNNIAVTYKSLKIYGEAIKNIDIAYDMAVKNNDLGSQAGCLDTKAQIYLENKNFDLALKCAEESLNFYRQGEIYGALVESLWTKTCILIAQQRTQESLIAFTELFEICKFRISEEKAHDFAHKFGKFFYVKNNLPFNEEVLNFERQLLMEASHNSGGLIAPMAERLGMNTDSLTTTLLTRHSDLPAQLGINIKDCRSLWSRELNVVSEELDETNPIFPKSIALAKSTYVPTAISDEPEEDVESIFSSLSSEIASLDDQELEFVTRAGRKIKKPRDLRIDTLFEITTERLKNIGLTRGTLSVVLREPLKSDEHLPSIVLEKSTGHIHTGFLTEFGGMLGVESDLAEPLVYLPEEVKILGKIIGYLRAESTYYVLEPLKDE